MNRNKSLLPMKLIRIDPAAKTVETVESTGTGTDCQRLMNCQLIDICARQPNGDALIVDDEALDLDPQPPAFSFNGYGPIHGIAILTGVDGKGGTAEPAFTLDQVRRGTKWLGEIYTQPQVFVLTW